MTRERGRLEEPRLEALLGDAFGTELFPVTEEEVAEAEAAAVEYAGELPPELAELAPRPQPRRVSASRNDERVPPAHPTVAQRRGGGRPVFTHMAAALLGAAAVVFWLRLGTRSVAPGASDLPGREPARPVVDAAAEAPQVALPALRSCGAGCCAGKACRDAKPELAECPSGRACVACALEGLEKNRYRLRIGAFAPSVAGSRAVERAGPGGLELCVRVGSSERACTGAHPNADGEASWVSLPLVAGAQDLVAGLVLEVRAKSQPSVVFGQWQSPVQVNTMLLCRGLSLRPKSDADEVLGSVSLFLDDSEFVELGSAASVAELTEIARRFRPADVPLDVYEGSASGTRRFRLVLGPMDHASAERLRWSVIEHGESATLTLGADHIGAARRLAAP
ncbi:MAG: hypothetical protein U0263_16225 [Polyangiaceae bacterium]